MDHANVEERSLRKGEIRDGVSVVEAFQVWPVFLRRDRPVLGCPECHLTVERFREDLVQVTLLTGYRGAIREDESD